jgi:V8-like Glu-specific endopeptidase
LIAPDVVLTAGHVVYNHDEGGWAEAMEVAPGADGQNSPFGISAVLDISAFRGWVEDAAFDHDMGLIYLETPLGDDAGWMGFAYYRDLFHAFINMAAYHTDLDNGTRQHLDSGRVQRDFRRQIEYRLDTAPGSSGAGAYVIDRNRRFVVATNSWQSSRTNGGCRINRAKFQALSAAVD